MGKTFNSINAYNSEGVVLNKKEIYCLRLTLHNSNDSEIRTFLEIDSDELFLIRKNIMYKLKCSTWHKSILKAFEYNFLKQEDYINNIVKEKALALSKQVFKNITINQNKEYVNYLILEIQEFLKGCNKKRFNKNFVLTENIYLQQRFKRITNYSINEQLNQTSEKSERAFWNNINKLKFNFWNTNLKEIFQFKMTTKKENHLPLNKIEIETLEIAAKIAFFISNNETFLSKEKELFIYHEIIKYYAKIEFDYLS